MLRLADLSYNLIDKGNNLLVDGMRLINGLNHLLFGNLISPGLNHNHLLAGRSHGQVQISILPLLLRWVDHKFPIYHPHLGGRARAGKRNIRNAGRNRRPQHRHQLRTALWIHAHYQVIQSYVIAVVLGEQRAHRAVNHA